MRFLTHQECAVWCSNRSYPTRQYPEENVGYRPDLRTADFHFVDFVSPQDSGRKVWLTRLLYSLIDPAPELLIWVGDSTVWPNSQHMPLFTRFRQAFGEYRPLIEAPGHVLDPLEVDDAVSIISLAFLFFWDCHVLSWSGRDAFFTSHDEFGWFASRDELVIDAIRNRLKEALKRETDAGAD